MVTDDRALREPSQRRERTRQRLMDAAAIVFAESGLDGASVEAICERAGYTRGAFYSNFETKDELFLELAGRVAREQVEAVEAKVRELVAGGPMDEATVAGALSPIEIVQRVLEVSGSGRATILLMSEIRIRALRAPEMAAAYLSLGDEMVKSVEKIICELSTAHGLRFRTTPGEAARLLISFYESAAAGAAMAGLDDAAISARVGDEIGALALLLLDPSAEGGRAAAGGRGAAQPRVVGEPRSAVSRPSPA